MLSGYGRRVSDDAGLDEARSIAQRVGPWSGRTIEMEALPGGMTNRNFVARVDDEQARYVVRLTGANTHLLGIDRRTEFAAATHAALLGLAPEVVDFVEPEGSLVTRFLDGAEQPDLLDDEVMTRVGSLLRSVHAGPELATRFDCFEVPRTYARVASIRGGVVPAALEGSLAIADRIERVFASQPEPLVPAHNDLLRSNFLRSPDGHLWLIDWEYAGMNSRWFDLGNLAANNELDRDARDALLFAYAGSVTVGGAARIELMQVMSDLREAMWGVVQQAVSDIEFDFVDYAQRHFDRLLRTVGTNQFERSLARANED